MWMRRVAWLAVPDVLAMPINLLRQHEQQALGLARARL